MIGAGFGWGTVNGVIDKASFRWDNDAYLSSSKEVLENLDGENVAPNESIPCQLRWRLIGDTDGEDGEGVSWANSII